MKTTADFLDALHAHFGVTTDYALQPFTDWHKQQISRYRTLKSTFDARTGERVGKWLGLEPEYVKACMAAQRAEHPEVREAWERVAKRLATGAGALLVAVGLGAEFDISEIPAQASSVHEPAGIHIMRNAAQAARRLARRALERLAAFARTLGSTAGAGLVVL